MHKANSAKRQSKISTGLIATYVVVPTNDSKTNCERPSGTARSYCASVSVTAPLKAHSQRNCQGCSQPILRPVNRPTNFGFDHSATCNKLCIVGVS